MQYFSKEINLDVFHDIVSKSEIARSVYSLLFLVKKYFGGNDNLLPRLETGDVDFKFTAAMEKIMFSPGNDSREIFIRLFAADSTWKKVKLIFADIFPDRQKMSERYAVQPSSTKVYFYYVYRPFELLLNYGRSFLKMLCFRDSG
jgi:hypothetical protein